MNTKKLVGIIAVGVLLILGLVFPRGNTVVERVVEKFGNASPDHYFAEFFYAGFTVGNTLSTTTTGTGATLKASDLVGYDTILVTPNTGVFTYTFPASSTLQSLVPRAGMTQRTCFYNATSTAAATITFVAGTGIDWEIASSSGSTTGAAAPIPALGTACFTFIRQAATATTFDITALYMPFENAD